MAGLVSVALVDTGKGHEKGFAAAAVERKKKSGAGVAGVKRQLGLGHLLGRQWCWDFCRAESRDSDET